MPALSPAAPPPGSAGPSGAAGRDAAIALVAALLIGAWDLAGVDLAVMRHFGSAHGFPWREHWLLSTVLHDGARGAGWLAVAALAANVWKPWPFARGLTRSERLHWLAATLSCAVVVPLMKHASATSCPWTLAEFGGTVLRHVPHWWPGRVDGGPGGCFPSGHASTAFSFVGGWFALRGHAPRAARRWLGATVLAGLLLGGVQVVRGAHFPSHPLWTAWICWTLSAALHHGTRRFAPQQGLRRFTARATAQAGTSASSRSKGSSSAASCGASASFTA